MKKLLAVFAIGLGIIFAGFTSAETTINCKWGEDSANANEQLNKICEKAKKAQEYSGKWIPKEKPSEEQNIQSARKLFKEGQEIMDKISIGMEEGSDSYMSEIELESNFIKADEKFTQAEKIGRKPVIHSGGILPGPDESGDGKDYLVNGFLVKLINGSLVLLFSIGTLILIIGGLMFLFSSGDEEIKTKAKDAIFWGVVGLVIAVMAYAIVKFVVGLDFGF